MYRIYYSPLIKQHQVVSGHPESIARIDAIVQHLKNSPQIQRNWKWLETTETATLDWYQYAHPKTFVQQTQHDLEQIQDHYPVYLNDADTCCSSNTLQALQATAKINKDSVNWLLSEANSTNNIGLCINRPPGHHAEKMAVMGFCFFNHIANNAIYSKKYWKLERVAVLDFDVHHGNGTENIFQDYDSFFFASTFAKNIFPAGSKACDQPHRQLKALSTNFSSDEFRQAWNDIWVKLQNYQPKFILVSAGFDAHMDDPLAPAQLTYEDYHWLGEQLATFNRSGIPILNCLEGGYDLIALAHSLEQFLLGLSCRSIS